jgi:ornithine decarboxylase
MHCLRPDAVVEAAANFVAGFPGDVLYAVKCNPDPAVLLAVWDGGVRHFDCASAPEVALVRRLLPDAAIHFMHPVKSRPGIRAAWAAGVRDFSLDHSGELAKIRQETSGDGELGLFVRLAMPRGRAAYDLSGKFGASVDDAAALLRVARPHAARLGLCFHVGSQCLDPLAWRDAMALVGATIARADVAVDVIDVGGGFPAAYPGSEPPPLGAFFAEIQAGLDALDLPVPPRLWAEPGRALVAGAVSVVCAGAAAQRRCAVRDRRCLWQPVGCRRTWLSLPRASAASRRAARRGYDARLHTVWPHLRFGRPHVRPLFAAR